MLRCPIFDGVSGVRQDFKSAFLASYLRRLPASLPALRSVSEPPQSDAANKLYVTFFHFVQPMLSYPSRVESKSEPKLLLEASDAIPADSRCDVFEVLRQVGNWMELVHFNELEPTPSQPCPPSLLILFFPRFTCMTKDMKS